MHEWQAPLFLLGIPLIPLLLFWRRRKRPRYRFASLALVRPVRSPRRLLAWLPELSLGLGLALCLVALARPQLTRKETVVRSEGIDILLALDVSGSMEAPDFTIAGHRSSRLDVAKAVIGRFVAGREHDRIGLVVFGEEAFTQVPLTLDHIGLARFLSQVEIGMAGRKATAVGEALAIAGQRLMKLEAPSKVVILLTDGRNNAGSISPEQAAEAVAALDIRVHTIGVGPEPGSGGILGVLGGRSRGGDLDEQTLQRIAELTGGRYFRADDTSALKKVYQTIDEMEKTTAEVQEFVHHDELYHRWLLWGLGLLSLHILLSATLLRRLP